jgi:hypothetical protein
MNRYKQQNQFSIIRTKFVSADDDIYTFHLDRIAELKNEEKNERKEDKQKLTNTIILKGKGTKLVRRGMGVPISALAQIGIEDPRGYSNESREWMRGVQNSENAHDEFFSYTENTLPKDPRFWNDDSIPDTAYAADVPIRDSRQVLAARPLIRRQF